MDESTYLEKRIIPKYNDKKYLFFYHDRYLFLT